MVTKSKLSTESYKGVRDFYPEDLFIQNYIFNIWRKTVESFGYEEYSASILEPAELYKAKTGEEIVNEQTYTFTDRGGRDVTLRPEMTPSVARLVAQKPHDLTMPLRWYSIPNLFRYEKPQRGRLREHWQLNVDLFGVENSSADAEIITVAYNLMKNLGAKDSDFVIRLNNRKMMDDLYEHLKLSKEKSQKISKIIDKKDKIPAEAFLGSVEELTDTETAQKLMEILSSNKKFLEILGEENKNAKELMELIDTLQSLGIANVEFSPTLMRGFDYYTGVVFEIFDINPENARSVFGGGRYDDLLDIFEAKKVSAVGFGAGDVTARDFLETHELLPAYKPTAQVYICTLDHHHAEEAGKLAETLRKSGLNVAVDLSNKKVGDQIKIAHKKLIPYVICIGDDEIKSGLYPLKEMSSGEEKKVKVEEIVKMIK